LNQTILSNQTELTNHYIKMDLLDELERGVNAIEEAKELIEMDSIDSYLRYFQTSIYEGKHIPSILLKNSKVVQRLLAEKLTPIVEELGFEWDKDALLTNGEMHLRYRKGGYSLDFAYFNPYERTFVFKFDIEEMERERDINVHRIKQEIKESENRLITTKAYLEEVTGTFIKRIMNFRNKKMIERLENNIDEIVGELDIFEREFEELSNNKVLLETIKAKLPRMEEEFSKYGISIQFVKGEIYDV